MLRLVSFLLVTGVVSSSLGEELAKSPQARIINGRSAPKDRFPWFVRTIGGTENEGQFRSCGGSLIAPDLIVTAAHCEAPKTVQVNAYDATKFDESRQRQVVQSVRHPSYPQGLPINFDIMVSKLESPITDVQPIKMNFDNSFPSMSGEELEIIGFGSTIPGPDAPVQQSQILQIAPTGYVPFTECAVAEDPETGNKNGVSPEDTVVEDWWLCTLFDDPIVTGTCFGDSGGPVFRQGKNLGTDLLVGIISGASGYCGNPNLPLWNNRVSYFQDWFTSMGCDMSDHPPEYWNCQGGGGRGGGNGEGSSSAIIIAVALFVVVILALVYFIWRRNKRNDPKNVVSKGKQCDEERPPHSGGYKDSGNHNRDRVATEPSSPAPSEASIRKESLNDTTSPLAWGPSGMFARRPSSDLTDNVKPSSDTNTETIRRPSGMVNKRSSTASNNDEKFPSLFGRKMSLDGNQSKNDKEAGFFDRKLSIDSLPGWLTTKPSFLKTGEKNDCIDDDSFVPPEIADMVSQIDKELDEIFTDNRSNRDRRSSDPIPHTGGRSRSVDRRRASDFADRRGRGLSRDDAGRRSGRSMERPKLSQNEKNCLSSSENQRGRSLSREPASRRPSRSKERSQPSGSKRSSSIDNARKPRSPSIAAETKPQSFSGVSKPKSFSTLAPGQSRPTRTGLKNNQQPRSSSAIVPGSSKRTSSGDNFTRAPVTRTKSDVISTSSKSASAKPALCIRPKAAPKPNPTPRAISDTVSSYSTNQTVSRVGRNDSTGPSRSPPPRTKSDSVAASPRHAVRPAGAATRGSNAPESDGYKDVFDQWKQRETSAKPIVTKNSDGTVTVARARRNEDGVKVITKTNYASLDLARRHGVDI
jgi:hypothetical protein